MLSWDKSFLPWVVFIFIQFFSKITANSSIAANGVQPGSAPAFNVTRVFNGGDVFSNVDPRCDSKSCQILGATIVRSSPCHCQCPARAPAFLQHIRQCSNSIEECRLLEFNQSGVRQKIPTLFLPLSNQNIAASSPIDWESAGVEMEKNGTVPCAISGAGFLTQNGWNPLDNRGIFSLHTVDDYTYLQWLGDKQDQLLLTGKVVQVTLRCVPNANAPDLCIVFRVIGKDGTAMTSDGAGTGPQLGASMQAGGTNSNERANQLGLIVGIVCGALLAVTLVAVAVFWTVCWKQQKERLARKIQLHVLYQQQRMQQQAAAGAFPHLANAFNMNEPAVSSTLEMLQGYGDAYSPYLEAGQQQWIEQHQRQNDEMARRYVMDQRGGLLIASNSAGRLIDPRAISSASDQLILPPPPPYPHARKKLFFSPEFFEPDLMVDPPPIAEEFLYEVRRMIDLAKNRIRSRRYVPSLLGIPEEGSSSLDAERKLSSASTSSVYSRSHAVILERRDSFSKMAQERAPEETLTIQELEHERDQTDSPRSSPNSADSRTAAGSSDSGPSSSSGCDGNGDRSSGEAVSGGRMSLDSGLGEEENPRENTTSASTSRTPTNADDGDKVTHWLNRLPPPLEIEENELSSQQREGPKHSKLFDFFNARQRLAQNHKLEKDNRNVVRVQVNEEMASQNFPTTISGASTAFSDGAFYRQRFLSPLAEEGHESSDWRRRKPEIATAPTSSYFDRPLRSRQQPSDQSDHSHLAIARKATPAPIYGSETSIIPSANNSNNFSYEDEISPSTSGQMYSMPKPGQNATTVSSASSSSPRSLFG